MKKSLIILGALMALAGLAGCGGKSDPALYKAGDIKVWPTADVRESTRTEAKLPKVELVTSMGRIVVELFDKQAPVSVENFLRYVGEGFYDGTIFHRVEPGMVVQGGGFTVDMERKPTHDPIVNEAGNGLRNLRGTLGVARTSDMNSGNSQFYINIVDNAGFNGDGVSGGYAVFGRVYEGMGVVDAMARVETGRSGQLNSVPVEPIVIQSARRIE